MNRNSATRKEEFRFFSGKKWELYDIHQTLKQAITTQKYLKEDGIRTRRIKDYWETYSIYAEVKE